MEIKWEKLAATCNRLELKWKQIGIKMEADGVSMED